MRLTKALWRHAPLPSKLMANVLQVSISMKSDASRISRRSRQDRRSRALSGRERCPFDRYILHFKITCDNYAFHNGFTSGRSPRSIGLVTPKRPMLLSLSRFSVLSASRKRLDAEDLKAVRPVLPGKILAATRETVAGLHHHIHGSRFLVLSFAMARPTSS